MLGNDPPGTAGSGGGGGTGGGSGGTGTPPATPVQPPRCTVPGTTRATIDAHALKVWLQAVDPLSPQCQEETPISEGIRARLQQLFDLVATRAGHHTRIQVLWTTDVSHETVGQRDIVIYFTNWYASDQSGSRGNSGVVDRYLRERGSATRSSDPELSRAYGDLRRQHITNNTTPSEGGLCVADTDGAAASSSTSVSEVFTDIVRHAAAMPTGATNWELLLRNRLGFGLAGMAFHEAMHNKVDPFRPSGWNLHTDGGGGLALGHFGWEQEHTQININFMGQYIRNDRRQYILPSSAARPATTSGAAGQPAGTGSGAGQPAGTP
jgi:hypothetical protein